MPRPVEEIIAETNGRNELMASFIELLEKDMPLHVLRMVVAEALGEIILHNKEMNLLRLNGVL